MKPNRTITRGHQTLAIYTWGAPSHGPTVLLVHGYPDCADVWQPIAEQLAQDHYVIAYDVRGSGRSSVPAETRDYELDELVTDMNAVIDAMSPDTPVHLVGHDWGSVQAWEAVTTVPVCARVKSFTSLSGPSLDHVGKLLQRRMQTGGREEWTKTLKQIGASWYMWFFQLPVLPPSLWRAGFDKLMPRLIQAREDTKMSESHTRQQDGINGIGLYRANVLQRLTSPRERYTDVPVQVLAALRDPFVGTALLDDIQKRVPNLWRRDLNTGHWSVCSHPQVIAGYVREFVASIESGVETPALRHARETVVRDREFSGKVVVITGSGSGIGRETALFFASLGATVVGADVRLAAAEKTRDDIMARNGRAFAYQVDVSDEIQMQAFAGWVAEHFGAPDIVVNNAGIGVAGAFLDTSVQDWDKVLKVNLWGVIHGSRLFGQQMVDQAKAGHIVNVASAAAYSPVKIMSAYATSKAAVLMLSECLRADFSQHHLRVSSICPGIVDTGITLATRFVGVDAQEEARLQARAKSIYRKRNLQPEAVARAILSAVRDNRPEVPVGPEAWGMKWLGRISPALNRRVSALLPEM